MFASHRKVNTGIDDLCAFGKIHSQEENVAPGAVREIHPHGCALAKCGETADVCFDLQQLRSDSQRHVGWMPCAKHPLIPLHRANTAPNLVGERLKCHPVIGLRQRTGQRYGRTIHDLCAQECIDGLRKTPAQQLFVAGKRDDPGFPPDKLFGQMKTIDGVQKEQCTNAFIKIVAATTKLLDLRGFRQ